MPEVHTDGYEEHSLDAADSQHLQGMKKTKRRLTVDPVDFIPGCDCSSNSRPQEDQALGVNDIMDSDGGLRELMLAEADMAAIFHQIVQEQHKGLDLEMPPQQDDIGYVEHRTITSRSMSGLSYSSGGSGSMGGPRGCSSYLPGLYDSEAEDNHCQQYLVYHPHPGPCSHTSQESLNSTNTAPQIGDLNRRMSTIETLLNCLEQKVKPTNNK
ncbi:hypothetical protein AMECASPLE_022508, partial [Ameca splendens]